MSFLEPAQLAWLALVPVLLALYIMKLRRREVLVTASFLWQAAAREARVDSFFQRLKVNLFLLLQLLVLAALVAGLARPYQLAPGRLAGQVVLLLDCSASMQGRLGPSTRFEVARQKARDLIRQAPGGAEVMLVALGAQARVAVPFTTDRSHLLRELERLEPQDTESDLSAVRPLAASMSTSRPGCELLLLGDQLPEGTLPANLGFLGFGQEGRNLALTAFQVFEREGRRQAFVALTSYSPQAESALLQLYQGRQQLLSRTVQVAARSRRTLTLAVPGEGQEPFELRLAEADDLECDNRCWSPAPRQQVQLIHLVGPVSRFVEKALVAQPRARVLRLAGDEPPGKSSPALTAWAEPDGRLPAGVHLLLSVPQAWREKALPGSAPLVLEDHPLVRGLPLEASLVGGRHQLRLPADLRQEVLARAGGESVLVLLRSSVSQAVLVNFSLGDSDLVLSPAFPMLMGRVLEHLVAGSLDSASDSLVAGQELSVRSSVPVDLVNPEGVTTRLTPRQGLCSSLETTRAGLYRLQAEGATRVVAVNMLSERESDLRAPPPDTAGSAPGAGSGQSPPMLEEYWRELALLALGVLWLEWFLYWGGPRRLGRRGV